MWRTGHSRCHFTLSLSLYIPLLPLFFLSFFLPCLVFLCFLLFLFHLPAFPTDKRASFGNTTACPRFLRKVTYTLSCDLPRFFHFESSLREFQPPRSSSFFLDNERNFSFPSHFLQPPTLKSVCIFLFLFCRSIRFYLNFYNGRSILKRVLNYFDRFNNSQVNL